MGNEMKIFAISDLHLSTAHPKPMSIFGGHWEGHFERIQEDWKRRVTDQDIVLLPGDHSWAMNLEDAKLDIGQICALPGKKVLLKGNHDFWWSSLNKVSQIIFNQTYLLQNNAIAFEDVVIAGTRGWKQRNEKDFSKEDEKIYRRELLRLKMSLDEAQKMAQDRPIIVISHYPLFSVDKGHSEFTQLLEQYPITRALYGHIHGLVFQLMDFSDFELGRITYSLCSCDFLGNKLKEIR